MLINLYGNIINPYNITRVTTQNSDYIIYMTSNIDATTTQDRNFIRISPNQIAEVDGEFTEVDVTFMKKVINKLWKAEADQKNPVTSLMSNS